jgi:asparagine synthase (glutamine-hydrolysing)
LKKNFLHQPAILLTAWGTPCSLVQKVALSYGEQPCEICMSCIAGIINLDGHPVDESLLEGMINTMKGRAPDAIGLWHSQHVGFAHAFLQTNSQQPLEKQPCSLDGKTWIVADVRIDGQQDLRTALKSHGRHLTTATTDAELLLHAYAVFGEKLLNYVIGDFAFVIWDGEQSTAFCACDHFGIRSLYFAEKENCFVFASEVTALLAHPVVSQELNETAVGDFLLFGGYLEAGMTIYSDIHRLPSASTVSIGAYGRTTISQYWQLVEPEFLPRMSTTEYVQEFKYVLNEAVKDRLIDSNNIALEMSGGMDSTSIAAIARAQASQDTALVAYTNTAFPLLPNDREAYYAEKAASYIGIPIKYNNLSSTPLFHRWGNTELATDQPCPSENLAFSYDILKSVTDSGARVITSGFMADALFSVHGSHHRRLLQSAKPARFLHETFIHMHVHKTWHGLGFRSFFNKKIKMSPWVHSPRG